jgi:nicotinamidase-related amidase
MARKTQTLGLQPKRGHSRRTALLVLDVMSDFAFEDGPAVRRAMVAKCESLTRLLRRVRRNGVPVIYVNDNAGPWRSDAPALIRRFVRSLPSDARCLSALAPAADDLVVLKPRHSAFYATPLDILLQHLSVGHLVLAGVSTESCVWMTACDAYIRGFGLIVPLDAVAGVSRAAVAATITGLRRVLQVRTPARASTLRFANGRLA